MITKKLSLLIALSFIGGNGLNAAVTEQHPVDVPAADAEHTKKDCNCSKKTKKRGKKSKVKHAKKAKTSHDAADASTDHHDVAKEHSEHTKKEKSSEAAPAMDHTAAADATAMKTVSAAGGTTTTPAN
jgi:hypothetical protein